jgi:bacillithiol synthase
MFEAPLLGKVYKNKLLVDLMENQSELNSFHTGVSLEDVNISFMEKRDLDLADRKLLYDVISEQYNQCGLTSPGQLDKIRNKGTFTITTGHQLCLFGGPQYFIHKIISIIRIADLLKEKYPKYDFLPVFWLASEDHDFKEVSSVSIFNKTISVEGKDTAAVGRLCPTTFQTAIDELLSMTSDEDAFTTLSFIFKESFKQPTWSQATRYWIHHLFHESNLVVLDADDKRMKKKFFHSMKEELESQFVHQQVSTTNRELTSLGYNPSINPRELNLFYLTEHARHRIIFEDGSFRIGDEVYDKSQILEKLDQNPENFSPNVLMRPLYQEKILPNLVYVGGPSEIAYWTQLKKSFDSQKISFPILLLRDHFVWLSNKQLTKWESLGFNVAELLDDSDALIKGFLSRNNRSEIDVSTQLKQLEDIEIQLLEKANSIDPSLVPMVKGSVKGMKNNLDKVNQKFIKSLKNKEIQKVSQIRAITQNIFKDGKLVERSESFISQYVKSKDDYLAKLTSASNPLNFQLKILTY